MAKLVSTRCPYWILAVLSLLHRGSNTSLTEPDLLGDGASKRIPRHCFLVTYDRKQLPVLNRFARVVRGFRTDTLAESRQGLPFATIATHGSLLRYTLVEGGIRSTVFADGYEFPCCPYILSKPFQIVSRGQGPTQHFAVTVDDRIPQEAGLGYGASYRTRLRFPPRVEHRNFFRWALPAIRGIHHLHANTSPSTHVNCTRPSSGLAGAAHPHFRPVLCHGPCSAFSRLGLVDATPRAPTRQAMYSIGSRPRLQISAGPPQGRCASTDGQDSALPFVPLPGRPGITGSVDATPTWSCASLVSLACGLRVQVTRSVVTTPRPSASASASNSQAVCWALTGQLGFGVLDESPVSPPCVVLCRLVSAHNVPKIVLGELIPPIPVIPVGTNAHGEVTEVTWAVSLPPSKRRPALHHAVDLAIALPLPRDSPVLRVTTDRLLTIASWCGKHESSSCIRMCLHSSQQLLVVLHTAQCIRSVAAVTMPSPAAKLKAARRLPKRLRLSGEEPGGHGTIREG